MFFLELLMANEQPKKILTSETWSNIVCLESILKDNATLEPVIIQEVFSRIKNPAITGDLQKQRMLIWIFSKNKLYLHREKDTIAQFLKSYDAKFQVLKSIGELYPEETMFVVKNMYKITGCASKTHILRWFCEMLPRIDLTTFDPTYLLTLFQELYSEKAGLLSDEMLFYQGKNAIAILLESPIREALPDIFAQILGHAEILNDQSEDMDRMRLPMLYAQLVMVQEKLKKLLPPTRQPTATKE